jgi:hypothetical protein
MTVSGLSMMALAVVDVLFSCSVGEEIGADSDSEQVSGGSDNVEINLPEDHSSWTEQVMQYPMKTSLRDNIVKTKQFTIGTLNELRVLSIARLKKVRQQPQLSKETLSLMIFNKQWQIQVGNKPWMQSTLHCRKIKHGT